MNVAPARSPRPTAAGGAQRIARPTRSRSRLWPILPVAILATVLLPATVRAVIVVESYNFPIAVPLGAIPDNGSSVLFAETIAVSQIASLTEVRVTLNLTGNPAGSGWAGDMFVSLNRNLSAQTAILLHQVGVTGGDPSGFGFDGWDIEFRDSAASGDVHFGQPPGLDTILMGLWQPDGRLSPTDAARPALLSVFLGSEGNADWRLAVADLSPGGGMTLHSWGITLVGNAVEPIPESGSRWAALAVLGMAGCAIWRRKAPAR